MNSNSTASLTRVSLSLSNLDCNMKLLGQVAGGRPLWPAIKANAYGHGAEIIAARLVESGFTTLCVAHAAEALFLKNAGIQAKFIILSPDLGDTAELNVLNSWEPVVASVRQMEALSKAADTLGETVRIHIKIDTGMGRVGFALDEAEEAVKQAAVLPGIKTASVMSHFPRADEIDRSYSLLQIQRFQAAAAKLRPLGIGLFHMANSAAVFGLSESHMDLCRPGISIYGLAPSGELLHPRQVELKPVLRWSTKITQLKEVPACTGLSYGHAFNTKRASLIATLPLGYGDGLLRGLSNKMDLLIGHRRCPQVGRICMDQCLVDVSELRGLVKQGDEAVIIGAQGPENITADELAIKAGTNNYEIVTQISQRVPRIISTIEK